MNDFDDFDIEMHSEGGSGPTVNSVLSLITIGLSIVSTATVSTNSLNSSTSVSCAIVTNATE